MNVTTINKFINLFLVGTLAMAIVVAWQWTRLGSLAEQFKTSPLGDASVVIGIVFFSLTIVFGAVVDGLTGVSARSLIQYLAMTPLAVVFMKNKDRKEYFFWRERFLAAVRMDASFVDLDKILEKKADRALATSICYTHAPTTTFARATTHYATHLLTANLTFVILCGIALSIHSLWAILDWYMAIRITVVGVATFYGLVAISVEYYFYSYEIVYRYAYLWLVEKRSAATATRNNNGQ